jgi:hypothetical protein
MKLIPTCSEKRFTLGFPLAPTGHRALTVTLGSKIKSQLKENQIRPDPDIRRRLEPHGSGSVIICTDPDPPTKSKKSEKNLVFCNYFG